MSTPFSSNNVGGKPNKQKLPKIDNRIKTDKSIVVNMTATYGPRVGYLKIVPVGLGNGSQVEDQKPVLILNKNNKIQNIIIGKPGADGIHCLGGNRITNVFWEDVGEDALTAKGNESEYIGTIEIIGGGAWKAADKVIQINVPCTLKLIDFYAEDFGRLIRVNGGKKFPVTIEIIGGHFRNGTSIVRSDSPSTNVTCKNCDFVNIKDPFILPKGAKLKESDIRKF